MARPTRDLTGATFGEPWVDTLNGRPTAHVMVKPREGKRFELKRSGRSATAALDALRATMTGSEQSASRSVTAAEAAVSWEAALLRRAASEEIRESMAIDYARFWDAHLASYQAPGATRPFGQRDIRSVTRPEIYALIHDAVLPTATGRRQPSAKRRQDVLRSLWHHAATVGFADDVTTGRLDVRRAAPQPKPISIDDLERIELHLASIEQRGRRTDPALLHDVWQLMRGSGARIGEALGLKIRDFDAEKRQLTLGRQHIGKVPGATPRSITYGEIPGAKTAAGRRTLVVARRTASMLARRSEGCSPSAWIFRTDRDGPLSPENYRSRLRRELEKLGLQGIGPHDLRDTIATALVRDLVDREGLAFGLQSAARLLGHSALSRALAHYVDDSQVVQDHSRVLEAIDPVERRRVAFADALRRARDELNAQVTDEDRDRLTAFVTVHPTHLERARDLLNVFPGVTILEDTDVPAEDPDAFTF